MIVPRNKNISSVPSARSFAKVHVSTRTSKRVRSAPITIPRANSLFRNTYTSLLQMMMGNAEILRNLKNKET
jgi:hypothetical protein